MNIYELRASWEIDNNCQCCDVYGEYSATVKVHETVALSTDINLIRGVLARIRDIERKIKDYKSGKHVDEGWMTEIHPNCKKGNARKYMDEALRAIHPNYDMYHDYEIIDMTDKLVK